MTLSTSLSIFNSNNESSSRRGFSLLILLIIISSVASSLSSFTNAQQQSTTSTSTSLNNNTIRYLQCGITQNVNEPNTIAVIAQQQQNNNDFTESNPCAQLTIRNCNFLAIRMIANNILPLTTHSPRLNSLVIESVTTQFLGLYDGRSERSFVPLTQQNDNQVTTILPSIKITNVTVDFDGSVDYRVLEQESTSHGAFDLRSYAPQYDVNSSSENSETTVQPTSTTTTSTNNMYLELPTFSSIEITNSRFYCLKNPDLRNTRQNSSVEGFCVHINGMGIDKGALSWTQNEIRSAYPNLAVAQCRFSSYEKSQIILQDSIFELNDDTCKDRDICQTMAYNHRSVIRFSNMNQWPNGSVYYPAGFSSSSSLPILSSSSSSHLLPLLLIQNNIITSTAKFAYRNDVAALYIFNSFFLPPPGSSSSNVYVDASNHYRPVIIQNNSFDVDHSLTNYNSDSYFQDYNDFSSSEYQVIEFLESYITANILNISNNKLSVLKIGSLGGITFRDDDRYNGKSFVGQISITNNVFDFSSDIQNRLSGANGYRTMVYRTIFFEAPQDDLALLQVSHNKVIRMRIRRPVSNLAVLVSKMASTSGEEAKTSLLAAEVIFVQFRRVYNTSLVEVVGNDVQGVYWGANIDYISMGNLVAISGQTQWNVSRAILSNNIWNVSGSAMLVIHTSLELVVAPGVSDELIINNNILDASSNHLKFLRCGLCTNPSIETFLSSSQFQVLNTQMLTLAMVASGGSKLIRFNNNSLRFDNVLTADLETGAVGDAATNLDQTTRMRAIMFWWSIKSLIYAPTRWLTELSTVEINGNNLVSNPNIDADIFSTKVNVIQQMVSPSVVAAIGPLFGSMPKVTVSEQNNMFWKLNISITNNKNSIRGGGTGALTLFAAVHFGTGSILNISNNVVERRFLVVEGEEFSDDADYYYNNEKYINAFLESPQMSLENTTEHERIEILQKLFFTPFQIASGDAFRIDETKNINVVYGVQPSTWTPILLVASKLENFGDGITVRVSKNKFRIWEALESRISLAGCSSILLENVAASSQDEIDHRCDLFQTSDSIIEENEVLVSRMKFPESLAGQLILNSMDAMTVFNYSTAYVGLAGVRDDGDDQQQSTTSSSVLLFRNNNIQFISYQSGITRNPQINPVFEERIDEGYSIFLMARVSGSSSSSSSNNNNYNTDDATINHAIIQNNIINFSSAPRSSLFVIDTKNYLNEKGTFLSEGNEIYRNSAVVDLSSENRSTAFPRGAFSFMSVIPVTQNNNNDQYNYLYQSSLQIYGNKIMLDVLVDSDERENQYETFDEALLQSWICVNANNLSSSSVYKSFIDVDVSSATCNEIEILPILPSSSSSSIFNDENNNNNVITLGLAKSIIEKQTPPVSSVIDSSCDYQIQYTLPPKEQIKSSKTKTFLPPANNKRQLPSEGVVITSPLVVDTLIAADAVQSSTMALTAVAAIQSPSLGFTVSRQQSMMNFARKALEGDCRGLFPIVEKSVDEYFENNGQEGDSSSLPAPSLPASDSPTQMSIGSSKARNYVGAIVGNVIFTVALSSFTMLIGVVAIKGFEMIYGEKKKKLQEYQQQEQQKKEKEDSRSTKGGKTAKKNQKEQENENNNNNNATGFYFIFAQSYVTLSFHFCASVLLSPTLSTTLIILAATTTDEVPIVIKAITTILCLLLCGLALFFTMWATIFRKPRREEYRPVVVEQQTGSQNNNQKENKNKSSSDTTFSGFIILMKSLVVPEGAWALPVNRTKEEKLQFLVAEPAFESYRSDMWFAVVELTTSIAIALPPLFAQLAPSGKSSCIVQGVLLCVALLVHFILLVWKNPFKLRILRIVVPFLSLQQLMNSILILVSVFMISSSSSENNTTDEENNNSSSSSPTSAAWLWSLITASMVVQGFLGIIGSVAALMPILRFLKKIVGRIKRETSSSSSDKKKSDIKREREQFLLGENRNNNHPHRHQQKRRSFDEAFENRHHPHHQQKSSSRKPTTSSSSHRYNKNYGDNDDIDDNSIYQEMKAMATSSTRNNNNNKNDNSSSGRRKHASSMVTTSSSKNNKSYDDYYHHDQDRRRNTRDDRNTNHSPSLSSRRRDLGDSRIFNNNNNHHRYSSSSSNHHHRHQSKNHSAPPPTNRHRREENTTTTTPRHEHHRSRRDDNNEMRHHHHHHHSFSPSLTPRTKHPHHHHHHSSSSRNNKNEW